MRLLLLVLLRAFRSDAASHISAAKHLELLDMAGHTDSPACYRPFGAHITPKLLLNSPNVQRLDDPSASEVIALCETLLFASLTPAQHAMYLYPFEEEATFQMRFQFMAAERLLRSRIIRGIAISLGMDGSEQSCTKNIRRLFEHNFELIERVIGRDECHYKTIRSLSFDVSMDTGGDTYLTEVLTVMWNDSARRDSTAERLRPILFTGPLVPWNIQGPLVYERGKSLYHFALFSWIVAILLCLMFSLLPSFIMLTMNVGNIRRSDDNSGAAGKPDIFKRLFKSKKPKKNKASEISVKH